MTSQLTVNDAINALDKKGKKGGKKAAKKQVSPMLMKVFPLVQRKLLFLRIL